MSKVIQKITVRSADRMKFIDSLVEMSARGAKRASNAVPHMIVPFWVDMEIEVDRDNPIKSSPTVVAYPLSVETYTEGQMRDMIWDEFRAACAAVGVKGRDREKMLTDYLDKVKNMA